MLLRACEQKENDQEQEREGAEEDAERKSGVFF